jgi:DNA adenine methylase
MLSNSDPKNINSNDNFFDELYKDFNLQRISAKRMINCQAEKRGNVTEIVITNYKGENK